MSTSFEPPVQILLVDDNPANLLALEAILTDPGLKLIRALSGKEALRLLSDQKFAVVLLDVRMPDMDGFETARRIRASGEHRRTPVIFLTADDGAASLADEVYALGAVDFLVKPLNPIAVRSKVNSLADLHREKERARREADQFRLLVQGTKDYAIFMLDPTGIVATWNAGAERIKGYSADEIVGRHFSTFYPMEAVDRDWPAEELRRAIADGRFEDEGWRVRKDGSMFWANVVITALRDEAGTLRGFSKVTRDLTERRQREEELCVLHRDLERRVEQRTAELTASNEALKEADRRKDEFIALLAHELRNPIAPIRNGLLTLRLTQLPQAGEKTLTMMERQVGHLVHLVDDLLDVARITQGRVHLRTERTELGSLIQGTVADHMPEFASAGVSLSVVLHASAWVDGDLTRLTQILDNLLGNARKFTPRGGKVEVSLEKDKRQQAMVRVKDTGIGIESAMLPTIFNAFSQADQSLERSAGGLGLGLSLVRGLAELHGGSVEAHSEGLGQGAEFIVLLPLLRELAALTNAPHPALELGVKHRVLIIEDNPDAAQSLSHLLTLLGHQVRVAMTGPDGVHEADVWRPDVILCDIGLPGLDGYGVVGELRRLSVASKARLIALTGYGSDDDRKRAIEAGFHHHVTKPADPAVLLQLLNSVRA